MSYLTDRPKQILQDGCLTRYGQRLEYLESTRFRLTGGLHRKFAFSDGGMSSPRGFWCLPGYEPQQRQHRTPSP